MHKDFSPEERLLRLIRSKTPKGPPPPAQPDRPKEEVPKEKLRQRFSFDFSKTFRWENLNLVLILLLAALLVYFIPLFFKRSKSTVENLEEKLKVQEKVASQKMEGPKRPSFDYFSENVSARNIFSPVVKEEAPTQAPVEEGPKLEEVKNQLTLLGVIGGATPQAIIEDKRTQKTYFLNKGSIFDDIEVGDILENKVILIYKGKQFELVL